jgi:hypothetical protein
VAVIHVERRCYRCVCGAKHPRRECASQLQRLRPKADSDVKIKRMPSQPTVREGSVKNSRGHQEVEIKKEHVLFLKSCYRRHE